MEEKKKLNEAMTSKEMAQKNERSINQFDSVLIKARNLFRKQLDKTPETKRKAISAIMSTLKDWTYTESKFKEEYGIRVRRLLDSRFFRENCKNNRKDPYVIATHFVFYGKNLSRLALEDGLEILKVSDEELKAPVFSKEELKDSGDKLLALYLDELDQD